MKKIIMNLAVALVGLFGTTSANATVYFLSDFDGLADSTKSINGGALSLGAYGGPAQWGIIRDDALTIYGGQAYNGANSGAISGLATDLANGLSLLRMTGTYKTFSAYDGTAWASTAQIQWQNTMNYSVYNAVTVGTAGVSDWTDFTLELDLAGLTGNHIAEIQANFFLGGTTPGDFHVDNLKIETVASIPEPSVASLLGFGVLGLVATRFRRRS